MIVVIGATSFLAREFLDMPHKYPIVALSHFELERLNDIEFIECIVNFAFPPIFYTNEYNPELDIDLKIARFAAGREIHYVMISSRKVYCKDNQWNAHENSPTLGKDVYGRNKLLIEGSLRHYLGNNLTVLRPGNVFGFERQIGRVRFGSYLLNQLENYGEIRLTISPFVRRDVVPVDYFCEVLHKVVAKKPTGIINVGSGQAVEVGQIVSSILEGFGRGRLINTSNEVVDEFQLDSGRLASELGLTCGVERIMQFSKSLGAKLKKEIEINVPRT